MILLRGRSAERQPQCADGSVSFPTNGVAHLAEHPLSYYFSWCLY
jgi:hypothetical protein